ncbi:hypothetical protein SODALDRAFT_128833 [Sodiomyces alkalinus F11]|uniref:Uncharacterized protein n=1 Tax=Sodiomyces alkalinus (strain CBS 110278 / VKM F-3762 / F11) TaxID=1314773 RepID=A0A3N2Q4Q7_SODAK|nr:hypothetical protein SODALDRAFT_128833 [Sodiomyces alkalinus F11]ROT41763.1 hypothetical protein SODALDRAFT_128833 [Sodiomyces alkalinus F11]
MHPCYEPLYPLHQVGFHYISVLRCLKLSVALAYMLVRGGALISRRYFVPSHLLLTRRVAHLACY